jgi:hypothetical protein
MELFRLAAFAVQPGRTSEPTEPQGGALDITDALRSALHDAAAKLRDSDWTAVDFMVEESSRTCEMRELALALSFGKTTESASAARAIAVRLGNAMDARSHPFLLILAAYRNGDRRMTGMWAFPRDDAFRFVAGTRPAIQLLADVFSRTSRLRKGAEFQGRNNRSSFLSGRVLDLQAGRDVTGVANYWIELFLECRLGVTPEIGTTVLARAIRGAYESSNSEERSQLQIAALALRQAPPGTLSVRDFAEQYLPAPVGERVLEASSAQDINSSRFRFRPETFDRFIATQVFNLDTGVVVTSPIDEVGESVTISDNRVLSVTGRIERERIKGDR